MSFFIKLAVFLQLLFRQRSRREIREIERLKRMIRMVDAAAENEIACQEAYRLLDQYADMVLRGDDAAAMMPQLQHHLEMCMDCREEFEALLDALRTTAS